MKAGCVEASAMLVLFLERSRRMARTVHRAAPVRISRLSWPGPRALWDFARGADQSMAMVQKLVYLSAV